MRKNKWKNELVNPLKDKGRTMKLEYFLSNNYVLTVLMIVLDLFVILGGTYLIHLLKQLPSILLGHGTLEGIFSLVHMIPNLTEVTMQEVGIVLIGLVILDTVLVIRIKLSWSETHFNVGQKGVSRFTNEDEIKQQYKAIEPLETPYPGNPGILISRIGETFYIDDSVVNNLILGITRSGKGETLKVQYRELFKS